MNERDDASDALPLDPRGGDGRLEPTRATSSSPAASSSTRDEDGQRAATISLVAGALGLTLLPLVGATVAIIAGHLARRTLRPDHRARRVATLGLLLGYLGLLAPLVLVGLASVFERPVSSS